MRDKHMKILMTSVFFSPHVGGIETVTEYLADEFVRQGHEVKIITATTTTEQSKKDYKYEILRAPSAKEIWKAYLWCDVFVHQGISLKWAWPALTFLKPWFIVYHQPSYPNTFIGKLKSVCAKFAHNICVSKTVAVHHGLKKYDVVLNSYDSSVYSRINKSKRKDFVFVGKVSPSKGVYVLLDAFQLFKQKTGSDWTLTIIGDTYGPECKEIQSYSNRLNCRKDIQFVGFKGPREIISILNEKQVQIVPSTAIEAFGVVVLEGMSCGCLIIGSDGDGISEAMGCAGYQFKKGDVESLCAQMVNASQISSEEYEHQQKLMQENIQKLSLENCAKQYLSLFAKAKH